MEKVLSIGVDTGEEEDFDRSMEELKSLAKACDKEVVGILTQKMETTNKALYIGTGKVKEAKEFAGECEAESVIFDNALSPTQIRNLGKELDLPIMDRTNLILDIFALRAQTLEAKLQVETARLQYMLPRLVGLRDSLSRQGGTSGSMSNKGTGEKKLELDRRKIEHRITELKKELKEVAKRRENQRKKRSESRIPQVALVGYTNAGKSTLLNKMLSRFGDSPEKTVFEKDMLFATLETSVRRIEDQEHKPFFLADTVGFIHKLPHGLIKAFQSTLDEVKYADLLIQVVDYSDDHYKQQMKVTEETLKEIDAGDIPMIIVYNKADKKYEEDLRQGTDSIKYPRTFENQIYMAASKEEGLDLLHAKIKEVLYAGNKECEFKIPYDKGGICSFLREHGTVREMKYLEDGILLQVNCHAHDADKYSEYLTTNAKE